MVSEGLLEGSHLFWEVYSTMDQAWSRCSCGASLENLQKPNKCSERGPYCGHQPGLAGAQAREKHQVMFL